MLFKEKIYGRWTANGRRPITIAHLEPSAKSNLYKRWIFLMNTIRVSNYLDSVGPDLVKTVYKGYQQMTKGKS